MNNLMKDTKSNVVEKVPTISYEIGGNVFVVGIHFNSDTMETMEDKINRMIKRDVIEDACLAT